MSTQVKTQIIPSPSAAPSGSSHSREVRRELLGAPLERGGHLLPGCTAVSQWGSCMVHCSPILQASASVLFGQDGIHGIGAQKTVTESQTLVFTSSQLSRNWRSIGERISEGSGQLPQVAVRAWPRMRAWGGEEEEAGAALDGKLFLLHQG